MSEDFYGEYKIFWIFWGRENFLDYVFLASGGTSDTDPVLQRFLERISARENYEKIGSRDGTGSFDQFVSSSNVVSFKPPSSLNSSNSSVASSGSEVSYAPHVPSTISSNQPSADFVHVPGDFQKSEKAHASVPVSPPEVPPVSTPVKQVNVIATETKHSGSVAVSAEQVSNLSISTANQGDPRNDYSEGESELDTPTDPIATSSEPMDQDS